MELIAELEPRSAGAGAEWASALDHEAVDHPVEGEAVVERLVGRLMRGRIQPLLGALGETDEVLDRLRSLVREEVDDDVTTVGAERRGQCHGIPFTGGCLNRTGEASGHTRAPRAALVARCSAQK